jgi:uncharacterized protein (TIGR02246 family)
VRKSGPHPRGALRWLGDMKISSRRPALMGAKPIPPRSKVEAMGSEMDTEAGRPADEREIRALHRRVLDAWAAGDGGAFAAPFSDDAVFVGFDGSVMRGREQIAAVHQELFDRWLKDSRLVEESTEVRFVGTDVAIVYAIGGTVMRGKAEPAPERDSIQTLVAVRQAGAWAFASFQNTRIRPIGAGGTSALLWLVPDKLWGLVFRISRTVPRKETEVG